MSSHWQELLCTYILKVNNYRNKKMNKISEVKLYNKM